MALEIDMIWSELLEKYGDNKDWTDKTCGCGFSIECTCGWYFTACMIIDAEETTICPYCGRKCVIFNHRNMLEIL